MLLMYMEIKCDLARAGSNDTQLETIAISVRVVEWRHHDLSCLTLLFPSNL